MTAKDRGVFDMLALSTINRWAKVDMLRPQSVAEHSFRVWVLVQDLYGVLFDTDHNSFEKQSTYEWALIHDSEEVHTGDIPSDVKEILERLSPGINDRLKDHVLRDRLPWVLQKQRGLKGTLPYYIVKIAETVETILYMREYGVNFSRKIEIENFNTDRLNGTLKEVSMKYRSVPWERAYAWVADMLSPPNAPTIRSLDASAAV